MPSVIDTKWNKSQEKTKDKIKVEEICASFQGFSSKLTPYKDVQRKHWSFEGWTLGSILISEFIL